MFTHIKTTLSLLLIFLVFSSLVYAQEDNNVSARQVGLTYSTLGGAGIHYIMPATELDNIKLTAIYIYLDENDTENSYFSLGVEYHRDIVEDDNKRAYLAAGTHIDNSMSEDLYFDSIANAERETYFSLGAGLGIDFGATEKGVIVNAHITYQLTSGLLGTERFRVGLGGGVGIGFNF